MSPQEYLDRIVASGLLARDELDAIVNKLPPTERPKDVAQLGRVLVQKGLLTRYQAAAIFQGHTRGLVLGNYVVLDKIGAGGMGEVFKARHKVMERVVAIKVLPASLIDSPEAVKRFHREVRAAARLIHPHIVTAFDAAEDKGTHFLAMEYVDGEDLAKVVDRDGPLPVTDAVDYVLQAAEGLAYAHAQGMIHRDIKPHNLLLASGGRKSSESASSSIGSPRVVKILDMGLARFETTIHGEATERHSITREDQIIGTVDYMSPEQAEGTHSADQRSDIYGLGCTLYRLLTGQVPYAGDTAMRKLIAHREFPIPKLRDARPEVPKALDDAFARMMAKQPHDRFASMQEVIDALRPFGSVAKRAAAAERPSDVEVLTEDSALLNFIQKHPTSSTSRPTSPAASATRPAATKTTAPAAAPAPRKPAVATPTENVAVQQAKQDTAKLATKRRAGRETRNRKFPLTLVLAAAGVLGLFIVGGVVITAASYFDRPTMLAVEWPMADRTKAQLLINEHDCDLSADPLEFEIEPGTVMISARRYGYEPIEQQFEIAAGERRPVKLQWVVIPPLETVAGIDPENVIKELDVNTRWPALFKQHQEKQALRQSKEPAAKVRAAIAAAAAAPDDAAKSDAARRAAAEFLQTFGGTPEAVEIGGELAQLATAADALARSDIPPYELAAAGAGNPSEAITQLTAVIGDSRLLGDDVHFAIAYSRDNRLIATGSRSNVVNVWDAQTKQEKWVLRGHTNHVRAVAFSPKEDLLASGGLDRRIKLWDPATGEDKLTLLATDAMNVYSLVFARDGSWLASGSSDGLVRIWNVTTGQRRQELSGHTGTIYGLAVSDDGKYLASASDSGQVKIWNTTTWAPKAEIASGATSAHAVVFDPQTKHLIGGLWTNNLGKIAVWDLDGKLLRSFDEKSGTINSLAFDATGKSLITAQGSHCRLWNFETGTVDLEFATGGNYFALSPDAQTLATCGQATLDVRLWNLAGQSRFDRQGHPGAVTAAVFSLDASQLISGGQEGTVRVWDVATRKLQHTLRGHSDNITDLARSSDGKNVASASLDKTVYIWNLASAADVQRLTGHTAGIHSVQFSPDGKLIATGGADKQVFLWNSLSGVQTKSLLGHLQPVLDVAFSPDGAWLASAGQDGEVRVWSVGDGEVRLKLTEHAGAVRSVAFSPDGKWLASAGDDRQIVLVELATGKKSATFAGHGFPVRSIAFTPDGKLLVSAAAAPLDKPGELMIWEVETQNARRRMQGPLGEVFVAAVDPIGRYIATGHRNGTVEILRAAARPAAGSPASE